MPSVPSAPSSTLPPLSRLSQYSAVLVSGALDNLLQLYWPPQPLPSKLALPTRKHLHLIHDDSVPDSGYASADEGDEDEETKEQMTQPEEEEAVELLRADSFERAFAIKWVTGFISRSDVWVEGEEEGLESEMRAEAVEKAVSILSAFTGNDDDEAAQCAVTRSFSFPTSNGGPDVHVELNDAPLSSEDHTSVGLQSWASSIMLAERMCADPSPFSLDNPSSRVLELGAGTGLLSIAAAKLLRQTKINNDRLSVTATDYHPAVLSNLTANVNTNFPRSPATLSVLRLDWETPDYTPFGGQSFDVILAADVIYHPQHARWIKMCVERLLTRPTGSDSGGHFWLIIPLRTTGRHENMDHTVDCVFPDASTVPRDRDSSDLVLAILGRESFAKLGGVGRADEGGYKLYKIGWVV
ncbi:hypothetical protein PQX77_005571 [Marasmius sp. AFHP31]|nr:hypothetical protein PQX77_005571 [Marasmius sp. AFHP31]